ncbi:MAG: Gx transporter family protein [Clostridia bacterium]|nr:Gx transporter family protein [Clostridia bacterium]
MGRYRNLVAAAIFAAAALTIFVVEAQIPVPAAIPGIKLGLANAITLIAIRLCGRRLAFAVLLVRIVLGAVFCGTPVSFLYSAAGGILCYIVTALLTGIMTDRQIPFLSVAGAITHNAGQLAVAAVAAGTAKVFAYLPLLTAAAVITGLFTGFAAMFSVTGLKKSRFFESKERK